MRRLTILAVTAALASTLLVAAPAKAYHPDPGDLLFRFVAGDWYFFFVLGYAYEPQSAGGQDPLQDCATGAPVEMERKKPDGWVKVTAGKTNSKGKFKKKIPNAKPGKYRAHILAYTTDDGNQCFEGWGDPKRFSP